MGCCQSYTPECGDPVVVKEKYCCEWVSPFMTITGGIANDDISGGSDGIDVAETLHLYSEDGIEITVTEGVDGPLVRLELDFTNTNLLANLRAVTNNIRTVANTALLTNTDHFVRADATALGFEITLPTAVGIAGKVIKITKIDTTANVVTVVGTGGEQIAGAASQALTSEQQNLSLISNGVSWDIY